jgi:hypothetical protein
MERGHVCPFQEIESGTYEQVDLAEGTQTSYGAAAAAYLNRREERWLSPDNDRKMTLVSPSRRAAV